MIRSTRKPFARRLIAAGAAVAASALVLGGCAGAPAEEDSTDGPAEITTVRLALPALSAYHWDVHVAVAMGFFEENGVEIEEIIAPGPAAVVNALISQSVDVGIAFPDLVLSATIKGAPLRYIAGQNNTITGAVHGAPDITDVTQLEGRSIASSNTIDALTLAVIDALAEEGLAPGSYDIIVAGSSQARFQALQAGGIGAAVLTAPSTSEAAAAGFPELVDIFTPGLSSGHTATERFISQNPEAATAYSRSIMQAVSWLLDPANKDQAIQILVDKVQVSTASAEAAYDLFIGRGVFQEGSPIPRELVLNAINVLERSGQVTNASLNLDDYVAYEILEAAQNSFK